MTMKVQVIFKITLHLTFFLWDIFLNNILILCSRINLYTFYIQGWRIWTSLHQQQQLERRRNRCHWRWTNNIYEGTKAKRVCTYLKWIIYGGSERTNIIKHHARYFREKLLYHNTVVWALLYENCCIYLISCK